MAANLDDFFRARSWPRLPSRPNRSSAMTLRLCTGTALSPSGTLRELDPIERVESFLIMWRPVK
jgi:hypothetical protein